MYLSEPIQTVLVSCRAAIEQMGKKITRDNLIAVDWHMPASINPPLYLISIGNTRFSRQLIESSRCFVVNFVPYSLKDTVLFCGRRSGSHLDKWKEASLAKEEAESVDCPVVALSCGYLECEVVHQYQAGDHVIFAGKVLRQVEKFSCPRLFHVIEDKFVQVGI